MKKKLELKNLRGIKIPARLGIIYNVTDFIVNEHLKNTGEICMSCLLDLQTKEGLSIMAQTKKENNAIIYNIVDETYLFEENVLEPAQYNFRFALEY